MREISYLDFDIIIERAGDKYRARVISSPAGQASGEFEAPVSDLELENFVLRLGQPRQGTRRIDSSMLGNVKSFGEKLFRTVFDNDVYACYLRSMDIADKENKGLRLRLHIDEPKFHDLPWEYLYNPQLNQFPALSKNTPIVRYFDLPHATQPLYVKPPLKILAMISSPAEYPPLDVEEEWKRLNQSLEGLISRNVVKLERLEQPTLLALQRSLRREPVHIFHYIGHGKYFEQKQDGVLLLEDENGRGKPVSGQFLGTILHDQRSLQLVVLNACEGARTSSDDPYAGVAQTLVQQGIPAVIAMQFEIFDQAALTFGQEFYSAVVDGYPVDAALSEARKGIFATGNETEWGTPVLFTRSPDSILFRQIAPPQPQETPKPEEQANASVQESADKAAQEKIERLAKEKETHERSVAILLSSLYYQATAKIALHEWSEARSLLEQIMEIQPKFKDVGTLLEHVDSKQVRANEANALITRTKEQIKEKDWKQAFKTLQEALKLAPSNTEAQTLMVSLIAELENEQENRLSIQANNSGPAPKQSKPSRPTNLPESIKAQSRPKTLPK